MTKFKKNSCYVIKIPNGYKITVQVKPIGFLTVSLTSPEPDFSLIVMISIF